MAPVIVSVGEAKLHFSKLIKRVEAGEEIVIARAGKPVAKLVRCLEAFKPKRKPGGMEGKIWISPDFDEPDPELERLFYDGPIEPTK